jgi:hypothetical protein
MADCRVCNARIFWALDENGEKVPLDEHEERDYGPGRYRITANTSPPQVQAIDESSPLRTYVDHRQLCQQPRAI